MKYKGFRRKTEGTDRLENLGRDGIIIIIIIQRMWNVKTRVILVIIGATGTISKSFRKHVSTIPGNHEVKELQKTAILGTAHILRKVLM
jgi:hypothetical protein